MKQSDKDIWIFLSHSNEDYDKVRLVRNLLEEQHFRPIMFFLKCLSDKDEIDSLIKREIDCRTRFILCDSANARNSIWVKREIEYMEQQQRTYQTIDLSKSPEEIAEDLKEYKENATLFISYNREFSDIAKLLAERLRKYDFFVFCDIFDLRGGLYFKDSINNAITSTARNGLFVSLVGKRTFSEESFSGQEIRTALNQGAKLLPIIMEKDLPNNELLDKIRAFKEIDVSKSNEKLNDALKGILLRSFSPGAILAFAEDFKYGRNRETDPLEEKFCVEIFMQEASKSINPNRLQQLGYLYEYGIGAETDLKKAYDYYSEAVYDENLKKCLPDLIRVSEKLGLTKPETNKTRQSIFARLFKKSRF